MCVSVVHKFLPACQTRAVCIVLCGVAVCMLVRLSGVYLVNSLADFYVTLSLYRQISRDD